MGAIIIISTPSADVQNREHGYSPGHGAGAQRITAVPTTQAFSSYPNASARLPQRKVCVLPMMCKALHDLPPALAAPRLPHARAAQPSWSSSHTLCTIQPRDLCTCRFPGCECSSSGHPHCSIPHLFQVCPQIFAQRGPFSLPHLDLHLSETLHLPSLVYFSP